MEIKSREQIKDRMVRMAAGYWNLEENEIEANFDPLLILLFDTVAGEMEQLGYRIRDIQSQLLSELSALMLPQSLLNAKPASAILTAKPNGATALLKSETNFVTVARTSRADEAVKEAEINFTPIGETKLVNASLAYVRMGSKVFGYQENGKKSILHDGGRNSLVNEIHFALHAGAPIESIAGLHFFFDLKNHSEAEHFYFALRSARLLVNDIETPITRGYYKNAQYETSLKDAFSNNSDYSRKIRREVAGVYRDQFFTVEESAPGVGPVTDQHALLMDLPEKLKQEIHSTNVIYGTLQLTHSFAPETIERLQIAINAFPAINRKLEKIFHKTRKWLNIIPLQVYGSYLDINSIEGANGITYRLQAADRNSKVEEGEAVIRAARVSKNSSSDIRNSLKSLLEAIRDESAYFSRTSNDSISSALNEISRILSRLEDQVQMSADEKPAFRYVLLKPKNPGETVLVNYWNTSPAEAGFVKAHAPFRPVQHSLIETGSCYSLTPALGGRDTPNDFAQKQMLVRQLSSKGKIISAEDLRLLCYELLGSRLKKAEIKKGMKIGQGKNTGISRFIDVQLFVSRGSFTADEISYLKKQLYYQLEKDGCFSYPFSITVIEQE